MLTKVTITHGAERVTVNPDGTLTFETSTDGEWMPEEHPSELMDRLAYAVVGESQLYVAMREEEPF